MYECNNSVRLGGLEDLRPALLCIVLWAYSSLSNAQTPKLDPSLVQAREEPTAASQLGTPVTLPAFKPPSIIGQDILNGAGGGTNNGGINNGGINNGGTGQSCSANAGGAPCSQQSSATQSSFTPNTGAGNPINVTNGNKYQAETDIAALPGTLGLEWVRHYNSSFALEHFAAGSFGQGWQHSYDTRLVESTRFVQIIQADGSRLMFNKLSAVLCQGKSAQMGKLSKQGKDWVWQWTNGRELMFNAKGRLVQIKDRTGPFVSLSYDRYDRLIQVIDPQQRAIDITYANPTEKKISKISSPLGEFFYDYKGLNLVQVAMPAGVGNIRTRGYHYENRHYASHLTGVTDHGKLKDTAPITQRVSTFMYDEQGRGVLTTLGVPARLALDASGIPLLPKRLVTDTGIEQVHLKFERIATPTQEGKTVLTNSLGQETVYTHKIISGQYRLMSALGPGCARCGKTQQRFEYDANGEVTAALQLDLQGRELSATKHDTDAWGRTTKVWISNTGNNKKREWIWTRRFEYNDPNNAFDPTLVAQPSVVPGQEHKIAFTRNSYGQITQTTEIGFSPIATIPSRSIEHTTRYGYVLFNNRSVLTKIDGPLANGNNADPSDSDITLVTWDSTAGRLTKLHAPGDGLQLFKWDSAGRLESVVNAQGFNSTFSYDAQSHVVAIQSTGPGSQNAMPQQFIYNALGQLVETKGATAAAKTASGFDGVGRPIWSANSLGILQQRQYNTEGQILQDGRYTNAVAQIVKYQYDQQGLLVATSDNAGRYWQVLKDSATGLPAAMSDALGRVHHIPLTSQSQEEASKSSQLHGNGAAVPTLRSIRDDFGRVVQVISVDSGTSHYRYDAAHRLIGMTDAMGNEASYTWSPIGAISAQALRDGKTGETVTTRWQYEGKRLVKIEHPTQSETYTHDDRGLRSARAIQIKTPQGEITVVTRYEYDAAGQLASSTLPDGSKVLLSRNEQGQVVAVKRSGVLTGWMSNFATEQVIAKDFERDMVGLKSWTAGNGVAVQSHRSKEGVLARTLVKTPAKGGTGGIKLAHAATAPGPLLVQAELPGAMGHPVEPNAIIDHRYLWDAAGNLRQHSTKAVKTIYSYDWYDRLIVAQNEVQDRYFYDNQGRRVLSQEGASTLSDMAGTVKTNYVANSGKDSPNYDAAGQPKVRGERTFAWDSAGKLITTEKDKVVASYTYDHRGLRIAKMIKTPQSKNTTYYLYDEAKNLLAELNSQGLVTRQYVYVADIALAVIDGDYQTAKQETQPVLQAARELKSIVAGWLTKNEVITWLHANHLNAPEVATDANSNVVWQASYAAFGRAKISAQAINKKNFVLNLRLPGQYEDTETGLHYNRQRYYDPASGAYLTPDPSGAPDGPNRYSYVRYNPLKYVDPDGLVLFAFDGTNNSNPPPGRDDFSNVYKFFQAYDVSPGSTNGNRKWYMNGVGRDDQDSGIKTNSTDEYNANTARARNDYMLAQFDSYASATLRAKPNEKILVDIVGFSRGAAMARDFSNRLASRINQRHYGGAQSSCIELRFLGLWDTVAQFGANGRENVDWHLAVPATVKHVFHAVAANENRYLFPGESIHRGLQRGFIGSHADIGGSYGTGDLSDVALNWIVENAKMSNLVMRRWGDGDTDRAWSVVTNPVFHDKSNSAENSAFCNRLNGGRSIDCQSRRIANIGGLNAAAITSNRFIVYREREGVDADGSSKITGDVNMKEYAKWLQLNYQLNISAGP